MPGYRRMRIAGGRYFFTVNLADRPSCLLTERVEDLRHAVGRVRALAPFDIDAWAVLPDHVRAVWTLPEGDSDFPRRWRAIKDLFSRRIDPCEMLSASRSLQGERGIWQRRYWEHAIRDDRDFAVHVDYVHFNPVKHGYVSRPIDWPYSSFRACVDKGFYPADWLGSDDGGAERGERLPAERRGAL
jgi:putative transposase